MSTYQILTLLGMGSLVASLITISVTSIRRLSKQVKAICLGVQAVLRSRMIEMYNKYRDRGYAPIYVKQDFDNCWRQYVILGANGVMNDIYNRFMALPDSPPKEEKSK